MKLFGKKKDSRIPAVQSDKYELVLRCSICSGEQILCTKDRKTGALQELNYIPEQRRRPRNYCPSTAGTF